MRTHSPRNQRIKREYFFFLKNARRQSEATVDAVALALSRFEVETGHRDFMSFSKGQAMDFKRNLAEQRSKATGDRLSQATQLATLAHLRRFFQWLAMQPGYKSKVPYSDADYFSLSDKDARAASARRPQRTPTLEQVQQVILGMPASTDVERRDRGLLAFALLTGARDSAMATMKVEHVDMAANCVFQDARTVKTKFSKSFSTYFFPVGDEVHQAFADWFRYLTEELGAGRAHPLFPATRITLDGDQQFSASGLGEEGWKTSGPVRKIFKNAFEQAGMPYFHPHSLRRTLVQLGERVCRTPEQFKAWSQNLGHEGVLTTFYSYGSVSPERQATLLKSLGQSLPEPSDIDPAEITAAVMEVFVKRQRAGF